MKEWIYIVSWTLVSITFNECPPDKNTEDQFGRRNRVTNCSGMVTKTTKFYDQAFSNSKKAWNFYIEALEEKEKLVPKDMVAKDYLIFVELDSTKRKRK